MFSAIVKKDGANSVRGSLLFQASRDEGAIWPRADVRRSQGFQACRAAYSAQKYQQCAYQYGYPENGKIYLSDGGDDSAHGLQDGFAELGEQPHAGRIATRRDETREPIKQQRE